MGSSTICIEIYLTVYSRRYFHRHDAKRSPTAADISMRSAHAGSHARRAIWGVPTACRRHRIGRPVGNQRGSGFGPTSIDGQRGRDGDEVGPTVGAIKPVEPASIDSTTGTTTPASGAPQYTTNRVTGCVRLTAKEIRNPP